MSPQMRKVLAAATVVAADPPRTPTATAHHAYVSWTLLTQLRDALDGLGIPWRDLQDAPQPAKDATP